MELGNELLIDFGYNHWNANLFEIIIIGMPFKLFFKYISTSNTLQIPSPGIVFLEFALGDKG